MPSKRSKTREEWEICKLKREVNALHPVHLWTSHVAKLVQFLVVIVGIVTFAYTLEEEREDRRDRDFQNAVSLAAESPTLAAGTLVDYGERAIPLLVAIAAAPEEREWPNAATVAVDSLAQIGKPLTEQQLRRLDSVYRRAVDEANSVDGELVLEPDPDDAGLRHRLSELFLFLDALCDLHPCPADWPETRRRFEEAYPEELKRGGRP